MQHDSPVSLDPVAAQGNRLKAAGVQALRPALEKLTKLTHLGLSGACGDVQWLSTQCARLGVTGEGAGQTVMVVCGGLFACGA